MASSDNGVKKRYWTMVLYPESAPEDWRDFIQQRGLVACVSPLHDKDMNPTGEPKKAHYHIILAYPGPTTYNSVKRLADKLHQPSPQYLEAIEGMYRYLTHKDNPDKAQYDEKDIESINGFDVRDFIAMSQQDLILEKIKIQELIRSTDITELSELADFLQDNGMIPELGIVMTSTMYFKAYLDSRRFTKLVGDGATTSRRT